MGGPRGPLSKKFQGSGWRMSRYHFVGIAGIGMSGLAQIVRAGGAEVSGSDRYFDREQLLERRAKLEAQGVRIFPQDGSGVQTSTGHLVISSAIEPENPDLQKGLRLGLARLHRSDLLASMFHACRRRVAVTGSFGKTTITAMVAWALVAAGERPMVANGGVMRNFETETDIGNALAGNGDLACIEADESDGTCVKYRPHIGVVTGLARDHKEWDDLEKLYAAFAANTEQVLVVGSQAAAVLFGRPGPRRVTFGLRDGDLRARLIRFGRREVSFQVGRTRFRARQIGAFSVFNALGAIAVLRELGLPDSRIESGLRTFEGVARHMELAGRSRGVRFFDDFAHNPSKVQAAIEAVRQAGARRVLVVFQPHGFEPARFMRRELAEALARALGPEDRAFLLPIYYVGGRIQADISSVDLAREAKARGAPVEALADRHEALERLGRTVRENDAVLVMGARDDSLTQLCRDLAARAGAASPAGS